MKITIRKNVLDVSFDEHYITSNPLGFLKSYFETWPRSAKVYKEIVNSENQLPLNDEDDLRSLSKLDDDIVVVVYPEAFALLGIALIAATVVLNLPKKKKTKPTATSTVEQPQVTTSPNNTLTSRQNQQRLGSRVADIYGKVRAYPDLLTQSYQKYENNRKVEYAYYCVSRGYCDISDLRDGDSLISALPDSGAEVFGPNTSPNSGSPILTVGSSISESLKSVKLAESINNITVEGNTLYSAYQVKKNAGDQIWVNIRSFLNYGISMHFTIYVYELNSSDVRTGATAHHTVEISYSTPGQRPSITTIFSNSFTNMELEFQITTPSSGLTGHIFTVEDAYTASNTTYTHFGNVTTIQTKTTANEQTAAIQSRRFNCLAHRRVQRIHTDGTLLTAAASSKFIDILADISLDPVVGNRQESELDLEGWYNVYEDVLNEFGHAFATEFSYTFDDQNTSYEEMFAMICETCFCSGYRLGNLLKIYFEKEQDTSVLLFNHRNKIPKTEQRIVTFGNPGDYDGIELEYTVQDSGEPARYYLPSDQSAVNANKIKLGGVQQALQAYFHAHRFWNRLRYENTRVEFEATQESYMLKLNDKVLVADNTRADTLDGEIIAQVGTTLTLSQNVDLSVGTYTIFMQDATGKVESRGVTQGAAANQVVLSSSTSLVLSSDAGNYARATYEIVENSSDRKREFLIDEIEPQDNFRNTIECVNYDIRYYQNDTDYINTIVDVNGEII